MVSHKNTQCPSDKFFADTESRGFVIHYNTV